MKNKLTRKLMLSAFTLLFAVISLGASTYAWFTMSKDATVDAFKGTVTSGTSGLEIAITAYNDFDVDPSQWSSTKIETTTINTFIGNSLQLDALEFNQYQFKRQDAVLNNKPEVLATPNVHYIAFNLHFRLADAEATKVDGAYQDVPLYLSELGFDKENVPADGSGQWYAAKTYTDGDGTEVQQGKVVNPYWVTDAARVGFDNLNQAYDNVYEASDDEGSSHYTPSTYTNGAIDYYEKVHGTEIKGKLPAGYGTGVEVNDYDQVGVLNGQGVVTITVYVWIDGWDAECINNIFLQTLIVNFKFSIDPKE